MDVSAMPYGWRGRIGRIAPGTGMQGAEEMRRWAPDGVLIIPSWIPLRHVDADDMRAMMGHFERAAVDLKEHTLDLIIQCCGAGTFVNGRGYDEEVIASSERATDVRTTTMMLSVIRALEVLRLRRVVLATPYPDALSDLLVKYLEEYGVEVLARRGFQLVDPRELPRFSPAGAYTICREVHAMAPEADGILFAGGGHRTFEVIERLETDTGIPVVTSNQASLWNVLRMVGVRDRISGLGTLLNDGPDA